MSEEWPIRTPAVTASTSMKRANTWASGRKSRVDAPVGLDDLGELLGGVLGEGEEVAVGELDALGPAGRARGVDDRGEAVAVERRAAGVELGVGDVVAVAAQAVDVALVDHPDVLQAGQPRAALLDRGEVGVGLDDHADGAGVGEDPLDLVGRGRLVDRHGHGAGGPQREVGEGPLVAGAAHDGDRVAEADAGGDQALGERGDVGGEGGRGDVGPAGSRAHGEGDATRLGARPPQRHVGEAALRRLGQDERRGLLVHGRLLRVGRHGDTSTLGPRGAGTLRAMADRTQSSVEIAAEPGAVLDVIADFERYPEWAHEVTSATVLSEDGDGWADQVEFHLNAGAIKDHYVLEYDWDIAEDGTGSVSWHLVRATLLKGLDGTYALARTATGGTSGHLRPRGRAHHADDRPAQAQGREAHHQPRPDRAQEARGGLTAAMARVVLVTGKGGVGKTTTAAATAVRAARSGLRTLVMSTDAAHSLGDALDVDLTTARTWRETTEVEPGLHALAVGAHTAVEADWQVVRDYLLGVLDAMGVDAVVADELTSLPGAEEVTALAALAHQADSGDWDLVVVDCAPTAETLRLLALPEVLGWHLDRLLPGPAPAAHRAAPGGVGGHRCAGARPRGAARAAGLARAHGRRPRPAHLHPGERARRAHPRAGRHRREPAGAHLAVPARVRRRRRRGEPGAARRRCRRHRPVAHRLDQRPGHRARAGARVLPRHPAAVRPLPGRRADRCRRARRARRRHGRRRRRPPGPA